MCSFDSIITILFTLKGDVLFLLFSGHGAQKPDPNGYEEDGMNECILPVDFQEAGMISDDEMFTLLVRPLLDGVRLTAVMDCCHRYIILYIALILAT